MIAVRIYSVRKGKNVDIKGIEDISIFHYTKVLQFKLHKKRKSYLKPDLHVQNFTQGRFISL